MSYGYLRAVEKQHVVEQRLNGRPPHDHINYLQNGKPVCQPVCVGVSKTTLSLLQGVVDFKSDLFVKKNAGAGLVNAVKQPTVFNVIYPSLGYHPR